MKLLKLINSENDIGQFYNILNSDLVLSPKSKIALNSIITQQEVNPLIITNKNNKVSVQLIAGTITEIELKVGVYTIDDIGIFLNDFNYKLNGLLEAEGKGIGYEYQASIDNNSEKMSILGKQSSNEYYINNWIKNAIYLNVNRRVYRDLDEELLDKSYCIYPTQMCQGASILQAKIYELVDVNIPANKKSFSMGLLKSSEVQDIDDKTNWVLGITAGKTTEPYVIHFNGTDTITTITPSYVGSGSNQNDLIQIQKTLNQYQVVLYNTTYPNGYIIFETDILENDDLENYGFIRLYEDKLSIVLTFLQLTPSPFELETSNLLGSDVEETTDFSIPKQVKGLTYQSIEFDDYQLAKILGYSQKSSGVQLVSNISFVAQKSYEFQEMVDAFQVELMNLKVDSYDCKIQGRNNILAIVPQSFNEKNQIVYQTNTPIFLDLLNANEIRLNQINLRLVKLDGSPLKIRGDSVIVLLIKNENE